MTDTDRLNAILKPLELDRLAIRARVAAAILAKDQAALTAAVEAMDETTSENLIDDLVALIATGRELSRMGEQVFANIEAACGRPVQAAE